MKSHKFKPYLKYGLFFMFMVSLVGTACADANQLVYYNWYEDTENTVIDNSGYENNGINYGSTTFTLPTGQTARYFNGHNRITIPENEQLASTDPHITFGVFFCYDSSNPTNRTYLVSRGNDICRISIDHENSRVKYEICADGHTISGYSECQVEPDEDYEAIVTYDGSHAQLYINGIASGKGVDYTATYLGSGNNANDWTIGSSPDAEYGLYGSVYAFYVYDSTLNPSEVLDLYINDIRSIRGPMKGGIALSWDDTGRVDTWYNHLSIFQKYNATSTADVNNIGNRVNAQTLVSELNALHSAGWEIAAHGYNHNDSRVFFTNHTPTEWLEQEIFPNIIEITRYGYPVYSFAYPNSNRTLAHDAILAPYFRTLRTGVPDVINDNVNQTPLAYYDWDDARLLYGVEIDEHTDTSLQSIEYGIDYAIATGNVLVLYGHTITPTLTEGVKYQTSTARLDAILNYTYQHGGAFYNMGDLGNSSWVRPARFSDVTANFAVSANTIPVGGTVTFTDYSTNQTTESLDFGDNSPVSNTANTTHTYIKPGTYTANLTVKNDVSSHSMVQTITVFEPAVLTADFTSNITTGFPPLSVAFKDTSTGFPASWSWDFGDGSTSTSRDPTHTYSVAGNYSVQLIVTNSNGSDSVRKENYITVFRQPLISNFTSDVTSGEVPLTVQFSDTSTGYPTSWNWNFGDGNTSGSKNPVHTYSIEGKYSVRLTVTNGTESNSTQKVDYIIVLPRPPAYPPSCSFTSNVTSGAIPLTVQFRDTSTGYPASWNWDFGDGNTSENKNPIHTYYTAGNCTVSLTVRNEYGTDSKTAVIALFEDKILPEADFTTNVTGGIKPLTVLFTDLSQNATSRCWDVNGDGIEDSNEESFVYTYNNKGTYTATLTAVNANGTAVKTKTIEVRNDGGGGGGGAGGSPEPAKNVKAKELSQVFIANGNHVKFDFSKNVTDVVYLSFDARKTAGKTTTIVEMLKNQSILTPEAPEGEVYNFLNIWVGNGGYATEENIENAIVCFRVKKSWIKDKNVDQTSIILNRYSNRKWDELPTTLQRENDRYLYFTSETPGFSPFAITAKKFVVEILPENGGPGENGNIEPYPEEEVERTDKEVSRKEKFSIPGFETIFCIFGLFGMYLFGRKSK